jgi:hypothetical protein
VFQRFNNLFKRKSNGEFDAEISAAQMIRLAVSEMELSIKKTTETVSKAEANVEKLQEQAEVYRKEAVVWNERAVLAAKSGQESFGIKSVEEKKAAEVQKEKYANLAGESFKMVNDLKTQLQKMQLQYTALKAEEVLLIGSTEEIPSPSPPKIDEPKVEYKEQRSIPESMSTNIPVPQIDLDEFEIFKQNAPTEDKIVTISKTEDTYRKIMQIWGNQAEEQEKIQEVLDEKTRLLNEFLSDNTSDKQKLIEEFLGINSLSEKQKQIDSFFNHS